MKILLDHCVPKRLRMLLTAHDVKTARQMGWEQLKNGTLVAEAAKQFDVLLTVDKKLQHELNLATLPLPIVVLDSISNAYTDLVPFAPHLQTLLNAPLERALYVIAADGRVTRLP
jgi:predicted nuclease of predicted toxin-antitoxin system